MISDQISVSTAMVLELHVWGPAFGLPSIEAQCLATIAFFTFTVPQNDWVLVASSDPRVAPTSMAPLHNPVHRCSNRLSN
jgi:hypothetical protein